MEYPAIFNNLAVIFNLCCICCNFVGPKTTIFVTQFSERNALFTNGIDVNRLYYGDAKLA